MSLPELLLRRSPSKKVQPSELQPEDRQLGAPEKSSLELEETVHVNNHIYQNSGQRSGARCIK